MKKFNFGPIYDWKLVTGMHAKIVKKGLQKKKVVNLLYSLICWKNKN